VNQSILKADQLYTWSDTYAPPAAQTNFCRVASTPPTATAPPAAPRSSFAGLSHRALQALRQAGMQVRRHLPVVLVRRQKLQAPSGRFEAAVAVAIKVVTCHTAAQPERKLNCLLLLINLATADPLTLRVGSAHGDRAALAVSRHNNPTTGDNLTAFHDIESQNILGDYSVRPRI
jgi:hypothetical protein